MSKRFPISLSVVLGGLAVLPGVLLGAVIADQRSIPVAVIVAAAGVVAAAVTWELLVRLRRGGLLVGLLVGVCGALAVAIAISAGFPRSGQTALTGALDGALNGWSALLTSPVPANAEPLSLVPVALVTFAAAYGGVLALRSPNRAATLLPSAVALVAGAVAAGSTQHRATEVGLAYLVGAALVLFARHQQQLAADARRSSRRSSRRGGLVAQLARTVPVAALIAIVGILVATTAGTTLTRDEPFDPRDHIATPTIPSGADNPLALVSQRLRSPDDVLFTVRSDRPLRTRLAAFDVYDGATWGSSSAWRRAGTTINPPARPGAAIASVVAEITIERLDGPWLPSIGDTTSVRGIEAIVDPASGSLATDERFTSGRRYTIAANVADFAPAVLENASLAGDAGTAQALQLPEGVPTPLQEMAAVATSEATTPFQRAALLALYLKQNFRLDPEHTPGHSYAHLVNAFPGTGVGTDEQFATAFAVMGRLAGMPTRIVVGFEPGTEVQPGVYEVRSGDVAVWPEVRFNDLGWVEVDASPSEEADGRDSDVVVGGQQIPLERPPAERPQPQQQRRAITPDEDSTPWILIGAVVVGGLLAALLVAGLCVWLVKLRRSFRRRRLAEPRQRVLGAWADVLDHLADRQSAPVAGSTIEEHLGAIEDEHAELAGIYWPVTRALYSVNEVTDDDAERAWKARDRFVTSARRREPVPTRVRHAVEVRSLRRRRAHLEPSRRTRSRHRVAANRHTPPASSHTTRARD